MDAEVDTIERTTERMKLFALSDRRGTSAFETCLCEDHFTDQHKQNAIIATVQHELDCQKQGVGHPDNVVSNFDNWQLVTNWPHMECIVCGKDTQGRIRP